MPSTYLRTLHALSLILALNRDHVAWTIVRLCLLDQCAVVKPSVLMHRIVNILLYCFEQGCVADGPVCVCTYVRVCVRACMCVYFIGKLLHGLVLRM